MNHRLPNNLSSSPPPFQPTLLSISYNLRHSIKSSSVTDLNSLACSDYPEKRKRPLSAALSSRIPPGLAPLPPYCDSRLAYATTVHTVNSSLLDSSQRCNCFLHNVRDWLVLPLSTPCHPFRCHQVQTVLGPTSNIHHQFSDHVPVYITQQRRFLSTTVPLAVDPSGTNLWLYSSTLTPIPTNLGLSHGHLRSYFDQVFQRLSASIIPHETFLFAFSSFVYTFPASFKLRSYAALFISRLFFLQSSCPTFSSDIQPIVDHFPFIVLSLACLPIQLRQQQKDPNDIQMNL